MADPRVQSVDSFTTTTHHQIPSWLSPKLYNLPPNTTVCIIGASSGIGEHIAYAYAAAGATNLILCSRRIEVLDTVASNITSKNQSQASPTVSTFACDVSSSPSMSSLATHITTTFSRLDIVIFCSGYAGPVTLRMDTGSPSAVADAFSINAVGTYHALHHLVPVLLSTGDGLKQFMSIGSVAACIRRGPIANTGYTVSKMAQGRLMEMAGEQFAADGLWVLNVHPGAVDTPMASGNTPEEFLPYLVDEVGLCGAVCVWLSTRGRNEVEWLCGRLVSANWDMNELMAMRERVVEGDLLKFALLTE